MLPTAHPLHPPPTAQAATPAPHPHPATDPVTNQKAMFSHISYFHTCACACFRVVSLHLLLCVQACNHIYSSNFRMYLDVILMDIDL